MENNTTVEMGDFSGTIKLTNEQVSKILSMYVSEKVGVTISPTEIRHNISEEYDEPMDL